MIIQLQLIIFTLTCDLRCASRQEKQEKSEGKNYSTSFMAYRVVSEQPRRVCTWAARLPWLSHWLWCGVVWCRQMSNHLIYHLHREQRMLPNFIGKHILTVSQSVNWGQGVSGEDGANLNRLDPMQKVTWRWSPLCHIVRSSKDENPIILCPTVNFSGCIVFWSDLKNLKLLATFLSD